MVRGMTQSHRPHRLGSARTGTGGSFQNDRERINRARQAAEALFQPKPPVAQPSIAKPPPAADPSTSQPRMLRPSSSAPVRHAAAEAPVNREPPTPPEIPASRYSRIRAWVKYGMTIPQVAQIYGVAVDEIKRIVRKA
jgi:hypothetical protein